MNPSPLSPGQHPLRGPNDERFGPRFFHCNDLYNADYRSLARKVARELDLEGIVRQVGGLKVAREVGLLVGLLVSRSGVQLVGLAVRGLVCRWVGEWV